MSRYTGARLTFAAGIMLLLSSGVHANEANFRTFIVGDRAAGMGGAACAIADALDACFYNPAGLVLTKQNSISVSASLYGFDRYSEDDALFPEEHLTTDAFMTIPSTMGTVWSINEYSAAALSVFVPKKTLISDIVSFLDAQHYFNFYVDDQTLWAGPSFGYALSPKVSAGASVFGVYRTYSHFESVYLGSYSPLPGQDIHLSQSYNVKYENLGLLSLVGVQYRPDDRWNLGMTFQTPSVNLWGNGKTEMHYSFSQDQSIETEAAYADNLSSENYIPARLTAGIAWQNPQHYAVAADLSYSLPTSFTQLEGVTKAGDQLSVSMRRESTVDASLGAEYYVRGIYPVRGGFFTSFSSAPDQDVNHREYPAQIDLYGLTCSVGVERERIAMNIGISYAFGSGKGLGWEADEEGSLVSRVVNSDSSHLFLFLNTSYLF